MVYTIDVTFWRDTMKSISVKEARKRLSGLLRAAERGETVTITRRGKRVAKLVPAHDKPRKGLPDLSEFRASLGVKEGVSLSDAVIEMRKEERY